MFQAAKVFSLDFISITLALRNLEKKTSEELKQFYQHSIFQAPSQKTADTTKKTANSSSDIDGRAACLEALKAETEIHLQNQLNKDLDEIKQHRNHFKHS